MRLLFHTMSHQNDFTKKNREFSFQSDSQKIDSSRQIQRHHSNQRHPNFRQNDFTKKKKENEISPKIREFY